MFNDFFFSKQYEGQNLSIKILSRTTVKSFLYHLVGCRSLYYIYCFILSLYFERFCDN